MDRLIAYAQGDLPADERAGIEADLRERPDLARALDQLHAHAEVLRRHFTFPAAAPKRTPLARYAAIAAVVVLAATIAFFAMPGPVRTVQLGHARGVMEGPFEPAVVCDTADKFRQYGIDTFGVPLTADFERAAAGDVALLGWTSYEGRYGRDVESGENPLRVLLARAPDGGRVIVVFRPPGTLRFDDDYTHGFTRHSTTLGGLVVDEIGTSEQPVVLPLLGVEGQ
jgi:hypothetical protein